MEIAMRIKNIILSLIMFILLICIFPQNNFSAKLIITPFLVAFFSIMVENIFLLLNKTKIAVFFNYIAKIFFFAYILFFLLTTTYASIKYKNYSNLIIVAVFLFFIFLFFRKKAK